MLSIRFSRQGAKKKPFYRIIVVEKARDPYGKYVESLGTYNPHTKETVIDADRAKYWLSQGAQASATVHNLFITQKVVEGEKIRASKSKPGKKKRLAAAGKEKAEQTEKAKEDAKSEVPPTPSVDNEVKESAPVDAPTEVVPPTDQLAE